MIGFYFLWLFVFSAKICEFYFYVILIQEMNLTNCYNNVPYVAMLTYYLLIFLLTQIVHRCRRLYKKVHRRFMERVFRFRTVGVHVGWRILTNGRYILDAHLQMIQTKLLFNRFNEPTDFTKVVFSFHITILYPVGVVLDIGSRIFLILASIH